jgi:hypothetical protein
MYRDRLDENVRDWYYKKPIREATGDSGGGRGSYIGPLVPGVRQFNKTTIQPFTIPVSKYNDAMLGYDSYDGSMDEPKKEIKKIESRSKKISNFLKNHPDLTTSDDDGNNINQTPGRKLNIVPIKEWVEITKDTNMEDLGYSNKQQKLYETLYRRLSKKLIGVSNNK